MAKSFRSVRQELNELHRATDFGGRKISQISGGRQGNPHTASKSGSAMKQRYARPGNQYVGQPMKVAGGLTGSPLRYGLREAIKNAIEKARGTDITVNPENPELNTQEPKDRNK